MDQNQDSNEVLNEKRLRTIIREELYGSFDEEKAKEHYCLKDPLLNKDKFKNRRRMAWLSFACMIALTLLIFFYIPAESVTHYDVIIAWIYGTFSSIIITYMGVTVIPYFGKGGQQQNNSYNPYQNQYRSPYQRPSPMNTFNQNTYGGAYDDEK